MEMRALGGSELEVSAVGLGCNNFGWRIDADRTREVVDAALEAGVTFFDTADMYGGGGASEELLGRALGSRRDQAVIATKFGHQRYDLPALADAGPKGGARYIERAVHDSLRRLGTDRIDLYQLHTPDPLTPIDETLDALDALVQAGTVRAIGHSNFSAAQIDEAVVAAARLGTVPFVSEQAEWSMLERGIESEVLPSARRHGLAILPYFPLANGLLTGKVRRSTAAPTGTRLAEREGYVTEAKLDVVEALAGWAEGNGVTLLHLAFGWLLAHDEVASVIAGATSSEQIRANAEAGAWRPTSEQKAELDALLPTPA